MGSLGGERSNVMASPAGNDSGVASDALEDTAAVLRTMREMNEAQTVRNEDIFGPVTNESVVIAIQGLALYRFFLMISNCVASNVFCCSSGSTNLS